jgi:hypothetical protein
MATTPPNASTNGSAVREEHWIAYRLDRAGIDALARRHPAG